MSVKILSEEREVVQRPVQELEEPPHEDDHPHDAQAVAQRVHGTVDFLPRKAPTNI